MCQATRTGVPIASLPFHDETGCMLQTKIMRLNHLSHDHASFHALLCDLMSFNCGSYAHMHWGEEHVALIHPVSPQRITERQSVLGLPT